MYSKKVYKKIIIYMLCSQTLFINSGCYIHNMYEVNGYKKENVENGKPFSNNYRLLLKIDSEDLSNIFLKNKFILDTNSTKKLVTTGSIYVYPEYKIYTKYDSRQTMGSNFSEGNGQGFINGITLVLGTALNVFLIIFFGSRLQDDSTNKRDTNYLYVSLFSLGIFNFLYNIIGYKVKEAIITSKVTKIIGNKLVFPDKCDSSEIEHDMAFEKSNENYSPDKNKIALANSKVRIGYIGVNTESIDIKTDGVGNFIIPKDSFDLISNKCLVILDIKSDMKDAKDLNSTLPYTIRY